MGVLVAVLFQQDVILFSIIGAVFGTVPDLDIHFDRFGLVKHRGIWSHSLMSSAILSGLCAAAYFFYPRYVPFWTWLVVFSATWMHTAADSLTHSGTHLFYPLSEKRFRGLVRYDSLAANGLLIIICAGLTYTLLFPQAIFSLMHDLP